MDARSEAVSSDAVGYCFAVSGRRQTQVSGDTKLEVRYAAFEQQRERIDQHMEPFRRDESTDREKTNDIALAARAKHAGRLDHDGHEPESSLRHPPLREHVPIVTA